MSDSGQNLVQIGGGPAKGAPAAAADTASTERREGRPEWLRIKLATPAEYYKVKKLVDGLNLNTVCQEARCAKIYECWGQHGTATFMILGDTCTRRCGFCAVKTGIMVGIGEEPREVFDLLADIRGAGVEVMTIGQYLQPTPPAPPRRPLGPPGRVRRVQGRRHGAGLHPLRVRPPGALQLPRPRARRQRGQGAECVSGRTR